MNNGHFYTPPTVGCNAILDALEPLRFANGGVGVPGGTGCVKAIKRLAAERHDDLAAIDNMTVGNLPAMLVICDGGPFKPFDTSFRLHEHVLQFGVICCANRYSSYLDRIAGEPDPAVMGGPVGGSHDASYLATQSPGIEDLLDWATYLGCRALAGEPDARRYKKVKPLTHRWLRFEPERYVAVALIEAVRFFDYEDDEPEVFLETVGLVHNPVKAHEADPGNLFLGDNTTPNTAAPATVRGGVVDL